eukprot:CAMPEP_0183314244 /NCGR_PEP_ID=MMETSP0160_2-20130417/47842_1 /TAXON_ID=2839 ORGANISM="Odontella Sinensis, Strain Grunow 1884" /NCGR_SAMPLE_ID=MMETSP0160_2 /ASSEMBLY_ACC=CAM_ASM_000250 /LENGTH=279 /DNA_ID=CAMNT_0025479523 /DNA_START=82 /DNA_END=921 /DNA_ORIENTATION=-
MKKPAGLSRLVFLLSLVVCQFNPSVAFFVNSKVPKPTTEMKAAAVSLAQYAPAAASLFNNMKTPASILAGAMVPLGFLAPLPKPESDVNGENPLHRILRKVHLFIAIASLCSELIAVMWATVAVNQLTEVPHLPAESVWHLLQRDCNLEWLAVNAHFLLGMLGFMSMIAIRGYFSAVVAGFSSTGCASICAAAASGLLLMVSIYNRGVAAGGGDGMRYGASILSLITTYVRLLVKRAISIESFGPLELMSLLLAGMSILLGIRALIVPEASSLPVKKTN